MLGNPPIPGVNYGFIRPGISGIRNVAKLISLNLYFRAKSVSYATRTINTRKTGYPSESFMNLCCACKPLTTLLRAYLMLLLLLTSPLLNAQSGQTVRVGSFDNHPIVFQNEAGKPQGLAIDVLEQVAKQKGWHLEYHFGAWRDMLAALEKGDIDILVGIAYSDQREEKFDFTSETLINNWGVLLQGESHSISSLEQLTEKRVALMRGSIHSSAFANTMQRFGFRFIEVPRASYQDALAAVQEGDADAAVVNRVFSLLHRENYETKETGIIFNPVEVRYAGHKNRVQDLLAGIDAYLREAKRDEKSAYYQALDRWLSDRIQYEWPTREIMWLVLAGLLILLVVAGHNIILSRQVKRRTAALTESETMFRQLAENIHEVFFLISPDWQKLYYISPAYSDAWGQDHKILYKDAMAWFEMVHPADREQVQADMQQKITDDFRQPAFREYRIVRPDKHVRWILARVYPIRDKRGRVYRIAGIAEDVTERRNAEHAVLESRARLSEAQRIAHIGSWELNFTNNTLYWSEEIYRIFAVEPGAFAASYEAFVEFVHPEDRESVTQAFTVAVKNKTPYDVVHRLLLKDSSIKYVHEQCETYYDEQGNPLRAVGTVQDITRQYMAEAALVRSKAEFEAIFNAISDLVVYADTERRIVMVNPAVQSVFGYTPDELIGKKTEVIYADLADFEAQGQRQFNPATDIKSARYEILYRCKDGSTFIGETFGAKVFDPQGHVLGMLAIIRDVTERNRAAQELEEHRHRLEELVEERTRKFETINKELEAFSYSVSHDLRAPLRAIDGFSDALYEDYADVLDETGMQYLSRVRNAAQRMSKLIDDLLKLSRVTRSELEWRRVDLSELAQNAINRHREAEPDRLVDFRLQPRLIVRGDQHLLQILMDNLIDNAWKYTRTAREPRIEVGEKAIDSQNTFYVRDNGAGFDMRFVNKLFKPFQRLHAIEDFEGTGIGLATVQRIINRHGGNIWAESSPGQGAEFYFRLGHMTKKNENLTESRLRNA